MPSIGSTPYGVGTTTDDTAAPTLPADKAAYLDPVTKDYATDDDGELQRMPITRQRVYLALATVKWPPRIGADFVQNIKTTAQLALQFLIDEQAIDLVNVSAADRADGVTGRAQVVVEYFDISEGEPDQVEV
jgi:hypothetical protein